jgi:hypothetical protein
MQRVPTDEVVPLVSPLELRGPGAFEVTLDQLKEKEEHLPIEHHATPPSWFYASASRKNGFYKVPEEKFKGET